MSAKKSCLKVSDMQLRASLARMNVCVCQNSKVEFLQLLPLERGTVAERLRGMTANKLHHAAPNPAYC